MTRRRHHGDAAVVDSDVVSGDWRVRADEAPRLPAAHVLRALGFSVPDDVTLSVFVDSSEPEGAAIVLVLRPVPHRVVDGTKGALLALWGRLGAALPYFAPWLAGVKR